MSRIKDELIYNRLGSIYSLVDEKGNYYGDYEDFFKKNDNCEIDFIGLFEIVYKTYLLGERTLVKGLKRLPWLSKPSFDKYELYEIYDHDEIVVPQNDVYIKAKRFLLNELESFVENRKKVGVLLSGGLDSRIIAGLLKEMQLKKEFTGEITAYTWGLKNCRDLMYSDEICRRFNWEHKIYYMDKNTLYNNFFISAENGAEVSPFHFHSLSELKKEKNVDCFIAASYGDSIGRGEFSGKKLNQLKKTVSKATDPFCLTNFSNNKYYLAKMTSDAYNYRKRLKKNYRKYQYIEIEQQIHYMRRKLQLCMNLLDDSDHELFQAFTSKELVELIWSLSPKVRTDELYINLLKNLPNKIGYIPWSRTGDSFVNSDESNKLDKFNLKKEFHKYGKWFRKDLKEFVLDNIFSEKLKKLDFFNYKQISKIVDVWKKSDTETINYIDEIFAWMVSLNIFLNKNEFVFKSLKNVDNHNRKILEFKGEMKAKFLISTRNIFRK